eukprot:10266385-Prorocentrum_lima.AAC.1
MTSSLVGSEMCIRDRFCAAVTACLQGASGTVTGKGSRSPRCWRTASTPVSYTHLTLPTICSV